MNLVDLGAFGNPCIVQSLICIGYRSNPYNLLGIHDYRNWLGQMLRGIAYIPLWGLVRHYYLLEYSSGTWNSMLSYCALSPCRPCSTYYYYQTEEIFHLSVYGQTLSPSLC